MRKSGARPDGDRGRQRKDDRVGNGVWENRTGWKVQAPNVVDRVEPTVRWQRPDPVDWVETTVRRKLLGVVDRVEPMFREHAAGMADREASVVRVERVVLLEMENEVGHADEGAEDSSDSCSRK
jgi:hypothetical protein